MYLQVGEYLPDQPEYENPGSSNVINVLPATEQSYRPFPGLIAHSDALAARCQGAAFAISSSGTTYLYAGDASTLYEITGSGTAWTTRGTGFSTASDQIWSFAQYGDTIIACNFYDSTQSFTLGGTGNFASISGAPNARYCTVVKDFVFLANTYDATDGDQPQRIHWSAIDDPTSWPTAGTTSAQAVQSDYQDFPGQHGWIKGVVGNLGTADVAIFCERAIFRGSYVGSPDIFEFAPAEGSRGTPAPASIAHLGANVFYLGEDGFYAFDGSNSVPIGAQKVDRTFFDDLDSSYMDRVSAMVDPISRVVMWAYPGAGNSSGAPNRILVYSWVLKRWSLAEIDTEILVKLLTFGYTLDQLDSFGTIDSLPYSLDSSRWKGGAIMKGAFNTSHQLCYMNGSALAATVDTSESSPYSSFRTFQGEYIPSRKCYVTNSIPIVDNDKATIQIGVRNRIQDPVRWTNKVGQNSSGYAPVRTQGRFVRARIEIPAGETWTHLQGVDLRAVPAGER